MCYSAGLQIWKPCWAKTPESLQHSWNTGFMKNWMICGLYVEVRSRKPAFGKDLSTAWFGRAMIIRSSSLIWAISYRSSEIIWGVLCLGLLNFTKWLCKSTEFGCSWPLTILKRSYLNLSLGIRKSSALYPRAIAFGLVISDWSSETRISSLTYWMLWKNHSGLIEKISCSSTTARSTLRWRGEMVLVQSTLNHRNSWTLNSGITIWASRNGKGWHLTWRPF